MNKRQAREHLETLKREQARKQAEVERLDYLLDPKQNPHAPVVRPGTGPSAALDEQHRLARWWPSDMASTFAKGWGASFSSNMRASDSAKDQTGAMLDGLRHELASELRVCPTYSVTPDMVSVVEAAAQSFPGQPLYPEDLPSPNGFVLLDRAIDLLDVHEKALGFLAFGWHTTRVQRLRPDGTKESAKPGIFLTMYSDLLDSVGYGGMEGYNAENPDNPVSPPQVVDYVVKVSAPAHLVLMHIHGIMFGDHYELADVPLLQNHLVFIETLFALMQQRITVARQWEAPRQLRRDIQRRTTEPPRVRIVTLRRAREYGTDDEHEPGFVEWSHRWMVSGHWRRLWNEERQQTRLVWVNPYIKGPADKPLVVKDTVYRLSR